MAKQPKFDEKEHKEIYDKSKDNYESAANIILYNKGK